MKYLRRMISGGLLGMALALAMTAAPAQAAGTVLYVDDNPANNGSTVCPATPHTTLPAALAALGGTKTNVTIYVCFGAYNSWTNAVTFDGFTNLKVIGKGGPILFDTGILTGAFITVTNSTKVTVSGLVLDGTGNLAGQAIGILFGNSSGTIKGNAIMGWHQDYGTPSSVVDVGILVYTTSAAQKVVVDRNTVIDAQNYGIMVSGPGKVQITRNRVAYQSDLDIPSVYAPGPAIQAGIVLFETGSGVKVTGNVVDRNSGETPLCVSGCTTATADVSRGILVMQSSGAVIKGNTVNFMRWGISVESWCNDPSATLTQTLANSNTISGNKLNSNGAGVLILANNYYGTPCVAHADGNTLTGNKINRYSSGSSAGVYLKAILPATAAGNVVKSNKFTGYYALAMAIGPDGSGVTGLVIQSNKITGAPLTGAAPAAVPEGSAPEAPPLMPALPW